MQNEIDYKHLRKALADAGCDDIDYLVEWTSDGVDEPDALRRAGHDYNKLAQLLMQALQDERDA